MKAIAILAFCLATGLYAANRDRSSRIKELTTQLGLENDNSSKDETISELINLGAKEASDDIIKFMTAEAEKGNLWMAEIAALALDTLDAKASLPKLTELLKHKNSAVRLVASIALRHMGSEASLVELRNIIKTKGSHEDEEIRVSAVGEIKQRRALVAAPDLVQLIALEAHQTNLASAAAEALRDFDLKEQQATLEKLTKDSSPSVRYFAAEALVSSKREVANATFMELLQVKSTGPDANIPEFAGRSLLQAQSPDLVPLYIKMLDSPDYELRKFAIETLGEMKVKASGPAIIKILAHRESDLRATAITAIDMINDPSLAKDAAEFMLQTKIFVYTIPDIRNLNFSVGAGVLCAPLKERVAKAAGNQKKWGQRWLDATRCGDDGESTDAELANLRPVLDAKEYCDQSVVEPPASTNDAKSIEKSEDSGCALLVDEAIKVYKKDPKNEEIVGLIQEIYRSIPSTSLDIARLKKETGISQEK